MFLDVKIVQELRERAEDGTPPSELINLIGIGWASKDRISVYWQSPTFGRHLL
jgi:hypothetical protein